MKEKNMNPMPPGFRKAPSGFSLISLNEVALAAQACSNEIIDMEITPSRRIIPMIYRFDFIIVRLFNHWCF